MRSGLAGLAYVLGNLAPLFLMCDAGDLGTHIEPAENQIFGGPTVVIYDSIPAGIGFSQKLFEMHAELIARALELVGHALARTAVPPVWDLAARTEAGGNKKRSPS